MQYKDFYDDMMNEAAADDAHKKGLKSAGWGRWKDSSGKIVAHTVDGKLITVKLKDLPPKPKFPHYQQVPHSEDGPGPYKPSLLQKIKPWIGLDPTDPKKEKHDSDVTAYEANKKRIQDANAVIQKKYNSERKKYYSTLTANQKEMHKVKEARSVMKWKKENPKDAKLDPDAILIKIQADQVKRWSASQRDIEKNRKTKNSGPATPAKSYEPPHYDDDDSSFKSSFSYNPSVFSNPSFNDVSSGSSTFGGGGGFSGGGGGSSW